MFWRFRNRSHVLEGPEFDLVLQDAGRKDPSCGIIGGFTYGLYEKGGRRNMGYVSMRLGESPELYYLGHIGYRVEEGYRGHGYAQKAVRLLLPNIRALGLASVVITTDVDNLPSRRTCESLGCVLERVAPVPERYQPVCMMSRHKCRYILRLPAPQ